MGNGQLIILETSKALPHVDLQNAWKLECVMNYENLEMLVGSFFA